MDTILFLLVLVFAFLLRFLFVFSEASDSLVHLWQIKKQKRNGSFSHQPFQSIIEGKQAYPSLSHAIITLFPEKNYKIAGIFLNLIYDLLSFTLVFIACNYITHQLFSGGWNSIFSFGLATSLIMATSPILLPVNSRLRSLGARTFGLLLFLIFFFLTGWAVMESSYVPYLIALPVVILVLMSSQFAMQALLFISLFYGLISFNFLPVLTVFAGFLIGYIIPATGIRHFLKYKINHYIWYFRNYKKGTTAAKRNNLKEFLKMPFYLFKKPGRFAEIWFGENSFLIAAYSLPPLVYLIIVLFLGNVDYHMFFEGQLITFISQVFLASVVIYLLTSFRPFLFLGSPERYFEYGVPFLSILFVYSLFKGTFQYPEQAYFAIVALNLVVVFIHVLYLLSSRANLLTNIEDPGLTSLADYMSRELERGRVLTIPTKISYGLAFSVKNDQVSFYYPFISSQLDGFKYMEKEEQELYLVKPDFEYFAKLYNIDFVAVKNRTLEKNTSIAEEYRQQLKDNPCVYSNEHYSLYQLK